MNKERGQRGGDSRTEEVNRAKHDSNPLDLLPDELLEMINYRTFTLWIEQRILC